jgi:hypothetical protein
MPKHNGTATKNTTTLAGTSYRRFFSKENDVLVIPKNFE